MAFVELSAEKYGVKMGGIKGNITFMSFDGEYKIQIASAQRMVFDERIAAAKQMVDQCIHRWAEGSAVEIKALVEHAFQTDREGKISAARLISLARLKINDEDWQAAMEALRESMQVASTTTYIRLYRRLGDSQNYQHIALDMASI